MSLYGVPFVLYKVVVEIPVEIPTPSTKLDGLSVLFDSVGDNSTNV